MNYTVISSPESPFRDYFLRDNTGDPGYLPVYSQRVYATEAPIPMPDERNKIISGYDTEEIKRLNQQFRKRSHIPLPELSFEWVNFIAEHLYMRTNNFIRAFMKRYIITDKSRSTSRSSSINLRKFILDIFKLSSKKRSVEEAKRFLRNEWEVNILEDPTDPDKYEFFELYLDADALNRMIEHNLEYNQKGYLKISPRQQSMINMTLRENARMARGIGARSTRRTRTKQDNISPDIYDGGVRNIIKRRKRTIRRKK